MNIPAAVLLHCILTMAVVLLIAGIRAIVWLASRR